MYALDSPKREKEMTSPKATEEDMRYVGYHTDYFVPIPSNDFPSQSNLPTCQPANKAKSNPSRYSQLSSSYHCNRKRSLKTLVQAFLILLFLLFHSTHATRISISSSLTGIQLVSTFIAFSKSESSSISRVPSIKAVETACKTSRPPLKEVEGGVEEDMGGSGSPRSMKTSQTRSWAGKGME